MATVEYWIQIENHPWDVCPKNIDRMTGQNIQNREPGYQSPVTVAGKPMYRLLSRAVDSAKLEIPLIAIPPNPPDPNKPAKTADEALILRRYQPPQQPNGSDAWTVPDDRKVNPWDLNEPDATTTHGTIPGPVIECNVGDKVLVHFRNMDRRVTLHPTPIFVPPNPIPIPVPQATPFPIAKRAHSLHPHGFAFAPTSDGAYPLSPVDPTQPIAAAEAAAWASVHVTGQFKQGDRVPPGGTYTYTWIAGAPNEDDPTQIEPWPTTAGIWLYHDHSICDMENVEHGAIGIIVIHNPDDPQDVTVQPADLPGGSPNGSPVVFIPTPIPLPPRPIGTLPHHLALWARICSDHTKPK
jgi:hypothetical protein